MTEWNFASVWEAIAATQPDRPAIRQGALLVDWATFNANANALAQHLLDHDLTRQSKVGVYLRNAPEYLETQFAAYKAGLTPFNINFRYGAEELAYLLDNADAEAVVFHAEFADIAAVVRPRMPAVKTWVAVARDGDAVPEWANRFDSVAARAPSADVVAPWGRSGDDVMLLYTGGTTGMPKGVMWRQDDAFRANGGGGNVVAGLPPMDTLELGIARLSESDDRPQRLICPPLMHGAGLSPSQGVLSAGGCVVLLDARGFDATEAWRAVDRHRIEALNIVGAAFAVPLVEAMTDRAGAWDLTCVKAIFSSGAMLDATTRHALLAACPGAVIIDKLGASEISSLAEAVTRAGDRLETATFTPTKGFALVSEEGELVAVRPGARGQLASSNIVPLGYHKDAAKTAATFRTINGVRYGVPGDFAEIDPDGRVRLLGRDSQCINTGGEKVFAEEVEEALKSHPAVRDAAVVGLPDPRFGATIFAVIELGCGDVSHAELVAHAGRTLASYKLPRGSMVVPSIDRLANGKIDYTRIKALAGGHTG